MADLSESQKKRAQARERRRKQPDESGSDDVAENTSQDNDQLNHAVRQAAKGAVAAAAVGAAAAAARKLASHDGGEPEPQEQEQAEPEPQQDEPQAQEADEQDSEREPEEREADREPVAGAGESDARRVLDRARDQLEDLLGRPVESVSSLERTHDGWVLALEVVEVRRIPETTDILASYEMELDDDLNLRRYRQGRRYHRAHADGGEET